jgi:hypothetical protein
MTEADKALEILQPLVDKAFESMKDQPTVQWMNQLPTNQQYAVAVGIMYQQMNNNGYFGWYVVNDYYRPTRYALVEFVRQHKKDSKEFDVVWGIIQQCEDYLDEWDDLEYDGYWMDKIDTKYYEICDEFISQAAAFIAKL